MKLAGPGNNKRRQSLGILLVFHPKAPHIKKQVVHNHLMLWRLNPKTSLTCFERFGLSSFQTTTGNYWKKRHTNMSNFSHTSNIIQNGIWSNKVSHRGTLPSLETFWNLYVPKNSLQECHLLWPVLFFTCQCHDYDYILTISAPTDTSTWHLSVQKRNKHHKHFQTIHVFLRYPRPFSSFYAKRRT